MKNTRDIIAEIKSTEKEALLYSGMRDKKSERAYNKLEKHAVFLHQMRRYSELSSYTEDSLNSQLEGLEGLKKRLTDTFKKHKEPFVNDVKAAWKKFRSENKMANIEKQVEALKYLLS